MARLDGRVAIVTGAGRGIGRSVARLLASEGASVVVNDLGAAVDGSGRDAGPAHDVVTEIGAVGGKAIANGADVSDHAAAEQLVASAIEQFGRLIGTGPWDADALADQVERSFGPLLGYRPG